jgi:hypothetical protein
MDEIILIIYYRSIKYFLLEAFGLDLYLIFIEQV